MAHTMENHPPHTTWNQPHQLDRIYNTYLSIKISLFTLIASISQTLTPPPPPPLYIHLYRFYALLTPPPPLLVQLNLRRFVFTAVLCLLF